MHASSVFLIVEVVKPQPRSLAGDVSFFPGHRVSQVSNPQVSRMLRLKLFRAKELETTSSDPYARIDSALVE